MTKPLDVQYHAVDGDKEDDSFAGDSTDSMSRTYRPPQSLFLRHPWISGVAMGVGAIVIFIAGFVIGSVGPYKLVE